MAGLSSKHPGYITHSENFGSVHSDGFSSAPVSEALRRLANVPVADWEREETGPLQRWPDAFATQRGASRPVSANSISSSRVALAFGTSAPPVTSPVRIARSARPDYRRVAHHKVDGQPAGLRPKSGFGSATQQLADGRTW